MAPDAGKGEKDPLQGNWGAAKDKIFEKINTYKYQKIDPESEMRVLKIYYSERGGQLQCSLITKPLPIGIPRHTYRAISYTWGSADDSPRNMIHMYDDLGGDEDLFKPTPFHKSTKFWVRDNLAAALRSLRDKKQNVLVWVDALCINQDSTIEKTAQVARMDDIYGSAETVCIWLGEEQSGRAIETFDFLRRILDLQELDKLVRTKTDPEKWRLIIELMKNRWFGRRWIIQELALAQKAEVRWGNATIEWSQFAMAIELFLHKYTGIQEMLGDRPTNFKALRDSAQFGSLDPRALAATTLVKATGSLFRKSVDGRIQQRLLNIEVLVSSLFRPQEAAEPKDTIYAVLSLAKDTSRYVETTYIGPSPEPLNDSSPWMSVWYFVCVFFWSLCRVASASFLRSQAKSAAQAIAMNLERKAIDSRLQPDYSKTLAEVYSGFVEYCIEKSQSLDILCRHWALTAKQISVKQRLLEKDLDEQKLPSWVLPCEEHAFGAPSQVTKGRKNADSLVGELQRDGQQFYNASAGLRPAVEFGKFPSAIGTYNGKLHVRGFPIATINKVSGVVRSGVIPAEVFEMSDWHWDEERREESLSQMPDDLWRLLVADRGMNGANAPSWYRLACLDCCRMIGSYGDFDTKCFDGIRDTPQTLIEFVQRVQQAVWNRRFFVTENMMGGRSWLGFASKKIEKGDLVVILFGCSVPVVLREIQGTKQYAFMGECYVHGIMDGEAIRDWNHGSKKFNYPYNNFKGYTII